MKKLSLIILSLLISCSTVFAQQPDQKRSRNNIQIMSGNTIVGSGTSTYIIDLKNPVYWPIVYGSFSLQFSGVSCAAGSATPGATIGVAYRQSNVLPSGVGVDKGLLTGTSEITSKLESINIVTGLAHDTGNTEYVYEFFPEKCRYLIIDVTAGAIPMIATIYIDMD